jgi:hypothetical protein
MDGVAVATTNLTVASEYDFAEFDYEQNLTSVPKTMDPTYSCAFFQ